jgi:hypothetical protein
MGGSGGRFGNGGLAIATATSATLGGSANATAMAMGGSEGPSNTTSVAGTATASSFAATINSYLATSQSTASGSSGQAQATAQTNFGSVNSVQTAATSQVGGAAPAVALAQVGSGASAPSSINPGQSFSVVNPVVIGPLMLAVGSMGAGGVGGSLAYQQTASFMFNAGGVPFVVDLLGNSSVGNGFDTATFQISDNGNVVVNQTFSNLAAAQSFFSITNLLAIQLTGGLNNIQLAFNETMSGGEGFSFSYGTASLSATPLPPTWTMMLIGLAGFGLVAYRRKGRTSLEAA